MAVNPSFLLQVEAIMDGDGFSKLAELSGAAKLNLRSRFQV